MEEDTAEYTPMRKKTTHHTATEEEEGVGLHTIMLPHAVLLLMGEVEPDGAEAASSTHLSLNPLKRSKSL